MSHPLVYSLRMKTRYTGGDLLETLIATFGKARQVRTGSGRYELRGSNDHDLAEAALNDRVYPGLKKKC